ncbi:MAG TPA: cyclodeaminase/cyclohydrolase family protein [Actinomycetota bacterium]
MTEDRQGTAARAIGDWLGSLASDAPTPGGGAFAGLAGAAGAAMLAMVARLTIGREGFEDVEARMRELATTSDAARARFLELADRDASAFDGVIAAFRMPKDTEEQRARRTAAIQRGYADAAAIPLEVARAAVDLLPLAETATAIGNPRAASDGYCGAIALHAAASAAIANVRINASSIDDVAARDELLRASSELRDRAEALIEAAATAFERRTLP